MWCRLHVQFEKILLMHFPFESAQNIFVLSGEIESFLSSAKEHGELWILFLYFPLKDTDIAFQVEKFAPLVTVWRNSPF